MRQAGTDPVVIAHVEKNTDEPILMELRLTNVGAGAAMNIFVDAEVPINAHTKNLFAKPFEADVLQGIKPLKVILQGHSVCYTLGTGPDLLGGEALAPFQVKLSYQDIEGSEYHSTHGIDVTEFMAQSAASPPNTKIWRELEKIRKAMK